MKTKKILFVILFILAYADVFAQNYCIPHRFIDHYYFRSRDIQHDKDIVYGQALNYKGEIKTVDLDIFYPKFSVDSLRRRPLIMLIHGGFGKEDKTQMHRYCPLLAERGFVVATINFRDGYEGSLGNNIGDSTLLMTTYRALQDANAAMRFLVNNSEKYGIDTNAIIVGGRSGGAALSLTLAYMNQQDFDMLFPWLTKTLGRLDNSTNDIKTTFNISGAVDMWGQILDTSYISSDEAHNIPIIMFHGTADSSLSPYNKSVLIAKRFQHLGGCYQLHTRTGAGHGEDMTKYYISAKTGCFIKRILCESCTSFEREIDNQDLSCDNVLPIDSTPKERAYINIDHSLITHYAGTYSSVDEEGKKHKLIISSESGHLYFLSKKNGFRAELFPESETDFFMREENAQISFNKGKNDQIIGLTFFIDANEIIAKRIK